VDAFLISRGGSSAALVAKKFKAAASIQGIHSTIPLRHTHISNPETRRFLINLVGADRVVIGTDNYAAMDVGEPNELVERLNLSAEDRDNIFRGKCGKAVPSIDG